MVYLWGWRLFVRDATPEMNQIHENKTVREIHAMGQCVEIHRLMPAILSAPNEPESRSRQGEWLPRTKPMSNFAGENRLRAESNHFPERSRCQTLTASRRSLVKVMAHRTKPMSNLDGMSSLTRRGHGSPNEPDSDTDSQGHARAKRTQFGVALVTLRIKLTVARAAPSVEGWGSRSRRCGCPGSGSSRRSRHWFAKEFLRGRAGSR